MPVYRSDNPRKPFLTMSNHSTRNQELSLRAKGLMAVLMDLPPSWRFSVSGLSRIMPDGTDAIRSAMHELESKGYPERIRKTGANGRSYVEYSIYEIPKETMFGKASTEKSHANKALSVLDGTDVWRAHSGQAII